MAGACRQTNAFNPTFNSRFYDVKVGKETVKQFHARYKDSKGFWQNEVYVFAPINIPE